MIPNKVAAEVAGKSNSSSTFAAPSVAAPVTHAVIEPDFTAFPPQGQVEPYSSLRRGMLYALESEGLIETVSLRRPGKARGRKLIVLRSLKSYLEGLRREQNG